MCLDFVQKSDDNNNRFIFNQGDNHEELFE